jgi:hypothetical protein
VVEQRTFNPLVVGSNPTALTMFFPYSKPNTAIFPLVHTSSSSRCTQLSYNGAKDRGNRYGDKKAEGWS